jgi:C-terminal processing protease CtpA/Prc
MNKLFLLLFIFNGILCSSLRAQDTTEFNAGSHITPAMLQKTSTANLALLGKVWGFLKYFHPAIAKGAKNWDYELFRIVPSFLNASTDTEKATVITQWIDKLGEVPPCKTCSDELLKDAKLKPGFNWMKEGGILTPALIAKLEYIKQNRAQGKQWYMWLAPGVKNPVVLNEAAYNSLKYPDAGYQLLSLYRYWNMIEYWFPYKHLTDEPWSGVLGKMLPEFIAADDALGYLLALKKLTVLINDSHAAMSGNADALVQYNGSYYPGVKIMFVEEKAVVVKILNDSLNRLNGLRPGDVITSVNGKTVAAIIREKQPLLAASNYAVQLRSLSRILLRGTTAQVPVTIERNGKKIVLTLHRIETKNPKDMNAALFHYQADTAFMLLKPGIGYINLGLIKRKDLPAVKKLFAETKGIVFDNRQYPGDFAIAEICGWLFEQATPFVNFTSPSLEYPGAMVWTKTISMGYNNSDAYKGRVMILINEETQSSGEYHTMAFRQAKQARVIGSTTAGADGNVSEFVLPGGVKTMFTGLGVYTPDRKETQRVGIIPDVVLRPTIKGIVAGKDELLDKAVELIEKE